MKTQTTKTKVLASIVGLALALGNLACDQNKGGNTPAAVVPPTCVAYGMPGYTPNCLNQTGMPGGMVSMMSVLSSSGYGDAQMNLQIGGNGATPPQPGMGYNGQVAIQGQMQLQQGLSFCGAYPGVYQVTTVQPGNMTGSSISAMQLVATGAGAQIQMNVSYAFTTIPGRLIIGMNTIVNGQPCGWLLMQ